MITALEIILNAAEVKRGRHARGVGGVKSLQLSTPDRRGSFTHTAAN